MRTRDLSAAHRERCPCGRPARYEHCCELLHRGAPAVTAEDVMRARFSAFAVGDADFLFDTWDPETRPAVVDVDEDTHWRRLQIVDVVAGGEHDDHGIVEFRASYRDDQGSAVMVERSQFVRNSAGRWLYRQGTTP